MDRIEFFVPGVARPGGSKRAFVLRRRDGSLVTRANGSPVVNVTDDAKRNKEWRANVAFFARQAYAGEPLNVPLRVAFTFVVTRPQGHFGSGRNAGVVKDSAPPYPAVKPDVLKLARSTEDALTGVLFLDDSRTVDLHVAKVYGTTPGCVVVVEAMPAAKVEWGETEGAKRTLFEAMA